MAVRFIRSRLGVARVKARCHSLLERLERLGSGAVTVDGRRRKAELLERLWWKERLV